MISRKAFYRLRHAPASPVNSVILAVKVMCSVKMSYTVKVSIPVYSPHKGPSSSQFHSICLGRQNNLSS